MLGGLQILGELFEWVFEECRKILVDQKGK